MPRHSIKGRMDGLEIWELGRIAFRNGSAKIPPPRLTISERVMWRKGWEYERDNQGHEEGE